MKKPYMRTNISRRECVLITLFQLNESKAWFIEVNLFCVGQNDQQARARTHTNTHTYIHTHTNTLTYTHTHIRSVHIGGRTNPLLMCIQLKYIYLTQYYYLTYFQVKKLLTLLFRC